MSQYPYFLKAEDAVAHYKLKERAGYDLAPLQLEDLNRVSMHDRVKWFYDVGVGKTVCSTVYAWMKGHHCHIVLMPPVLIPQWVKWLRRVDPDSQVLAYKGTPVQRKAMQLKGPKWICMSYDIFRGDFERILKEIGKEQPHIIVDECFPAGTSVLTPGGERLIETLRTGEEVLTSDGPRAIKNVLERVTSLLCTLEMTDGHQLTCTSSHPIFTDRGWLAARDCAGRSVLLAASLRAVQHGVQQAEELACLGDLSGNSDRADLLKILRDETTPHLAPGIRRADKRTMPWGSSDGQARQRGASGPQERGDLRSNFSDASQDWLETSDQEGQRHGADCSRSTPAPAPPTVGVRMECSDRVGGATAGLPHLLQGGLRAQGAEAGSGSRRVQPRKPGTSGAGSQERGEAEPVRVARVSCEEHTSPIPVFNLEVEGCPHYFAGGVLVHNCTALKSSHSKLFKRVNTLATSYLQLLTGTPTSKPTDAYAYVKLTTPMVYRSLAQLENHHVAARDFFGNITAYNDLGVVHQNLMLNAAKRTKEEMFPGIVKPRYQVMDYDLGPAHLKLYQELANEQMLLLEDGQKIDATTAQRLYHNLQQIIVNLDFYSGDNEARSVAYDLIDQTIDETQCMDPKKSKLIIWTYYKKTSASVLGYLEDCGAVGAYSDANTAKSVDRFLHDPTCRILVAQPMSAGFGLEPQHVCWENLFLEYSTVPIHFAQSVGRTDRKGQAHMPTMRIAVAQGTIQVSLHSRLLHNGDLVKQTEGNLASIRDAIYGKT